MDNQESFYADFVDDQKKKRKKIVYLLVGCYFAFMFFYTISISSRDMMFFTKVNGALEIQQNQPVKLRVFVIGSKEMIPLRDFYVRLELAQGDRKQILFSGASGRENFIEVNTPPLKVAPGKYELILTSGKKDYGEEINSLGLLVEKDLPQKTIVYQKLDEKQVQPFVPIKTENLSTETEIRLVCGNGRFIPNLNNNIMLIAEDKNSGIPVKGIEVEISKNDKPIAKVKTDENGLASFSYYAHSLGGEFVDLIVKDLQGKTFKAETRLQPTGSQVVLTPQKYWFEKGENISFKLESLGRGAWFVDLYKAGNLIYSTRAKTNGAPVHIDIPDLENVDGLIQVQVAENFYNPNTSFDAAYIYLNNENNIKISSSDERLKQIGDDPIKLAELKKEYSFNHFLEQIEKADIEHADVLNKLKTRVFSSVSISYDFDRIKLAEQVLREMPKSYIMLEESLNSSKSKYKRFIEQQRSDRIMALLILGVSGLFVILVIIFKIWREMNQRARDTGIKAGGQHIAGLIALLVIIIMGYAMMLYLFSILDWYKDI